MHEQIGLVENTQVKVLAFLKYGGLAASARQRLLQYLPALADAGIEVKVAPLLDDRYLEALAKGVTAPKVPILRSYVARLKQLLVERDVDLVWVQYELFPYLPAVAERLAGIIGKPIVVDYDDAIFHMYDDNNNPAIRSILGGKLTPLIKAASACICGNEYIRAYASRINDSCVTIPTVVDTACYVPRAANAPGCSGPPVVGWIGSPSTWRYVEDALPWLLPALERHGAILRVVGAGPGAAGIPGVESVSWSEATEVAEIQKMDLGIMPLPDENWARGKCGYKLIQYMACGVPVVASAVGANCAIVEQGKSGFLASTPQEWEEAFTILLSDAVLRKRHGDAGRRRVERDYSLASQAPRLVSVLQAAARGETIRDQSMLGT